MNKMTLVHIGIFTAGVAAGWILAKSAKKTSFANLAAPRLTSQQLEDLSYCTQSCNRGASEESIKNCIKNCLRFQATQH